MAGSDNLKVPTSEEARKNGRAGGIASGKARRERKALKETLETLLTMPLNSGNIEDLEKIQSIAAVKGKNITMQEAIMLAMLKKAAKGDVRAAEYIRDTIGEMPDAAERKARTEKLQAETAFIKGEDADGDKNNDGFIEALKYEVENVWDEE